MRDWVRAAALAAAVAITGGLGAVGVGSARAEGEPAPKGAPPTLEQLLAPRLIHSAGLSPDGAMIVGLQTTPGGQSVVVIDWRTRRARAIMTSSKEKGQELDWVSWKGDRVIFGVTQYLNRRGRTISYNEALRNPEQSYIVQKIYSMRSDGSAAIQLGDAFRGQVSTAASLALLSTLPADPDTILVSTNDYEMRMWRANVKTGALMPAGAGSASTLSWVVDGEGRPVIRVEALRRGAGLRYLRRDPNGVGWIPIIETRTAEATNSPDFSVLEAGPGRNQVYVIARPNERNHAALYLFNTATGEYGAPVHENPNADVTGAFVNSATGALIAACTIVQRLECQGLDPKVAVDLAAIQSSVGAANEVLVSDMSLDGNVWLIKVQSPMNPGSYWAFDRATRTLSKVVDTVEELGGALMAPTQIFNYVARDGTPLWAYLTGRRAAGDPPSPVIVLPHGGPEARDYYEYDALVQMLAARGYLVLQPNFRGSEGFGRAFMRAGQGQWGKRMQDDVIDAFKALTASGQGDATRACIVGWSYGGYAALMGLARDPELFRCGVSVAGVSDLIDMLREERNQFSADRSAAYLYWKVSIGELGRDDAALAATSPARMADRISAPLLLVHGDVDTIVPPEQSKTMAKAMEKAGKPVELMIIEGGNHGLTGDRRRLKAFERIDAFVAKHINAP